VEEHELANVRVVFDDEHARLRSLRLR
jgi:hypothetical protein